MAEAEQALPLTPGARALVDAARTRAGTNHEPGVREWLLAVVERHGPMADDLAEGVQAASLRRHLADEVGRGVRGDPLAADTVVREASARARAAGRAEIRERDVAAVVLLAAGYRLRDAAPAPAVPAAPPASPAPAATPAGLPAPAAGTPAPAGAGAAGYVPRARRPTPTLQQFGRDLTREAAEGRLSDLVGRGLEVDLVIETLCRRTKRNPALVGPAGVGKTAIVEGLARRIVSGAVPDVLRGVRLIGLQPSNLIAGASLLGEKESRMKAVVEEASQDGIILFIDEVHSIVGAGGLQGATDIAALLKPSLARGELACIGATTDDEYRRFIEPDAAMERRFQPVRVQEMTAEQSLVVVDSLAREFERTRGVTLEPGVLAWLVDFADRYLRNRHFPDKAVDLLEQCVAHAVATGQARVRHADAVAVAERLIGRPLEAATDDEHLGARLAERTLLAPDDVHALVSRLNVTMRGLDARPERPNAVVVLLGPAAEQRDALAETLAETLFGSPDRVVSIDFARFVTQWDVSGLIGSAPGYVGHGDSLAIHQLLQTPWCVLCCSHVDAGHPIARDLLAQALASGVIVDGTGRRIYLSDAIVIVTADGDVPAASPHVPGFRPRSEAAERPDAADATARAEAALGPEIAELADVICTDVTVADAATAHWVEDHLMASLAERFRGQGLALSWEPAVVRWLVARAGGAGHRGVERLIDEHVSALLVDHLPAAPGAATRAVTLACEGDRLRVQPRPAG
jgi:ATP-dependent Clp protease ATP-binding subunit ClpC